MVPGIQRRQKPQAGGAKRVGVRMALIRMPVFCVAVTCVAVIAMAVSVFADGHGHHGHHGYGHSYGYGHYSYGHRYGYGHSYSPHPYRYSYSPYSSGYYGYGRSPYSYHHYSYRPYYYGYRSYTYGYSPYSGRYLYGGSIYADRPSPPGSYGRTASKGPARDGDVHALQGRGWALLVAGQNGAARSAFADQAENNPNKGGPKLGYALAAAMGGDLATGTWAMRRACRLDPQAMHDVALDSKLRPRIAELIRRYQAGRDTAAQDIDSAFMLAALHYLTGDLAAARTAIEHSVEQGDRNRSTVSLQRLIDSRRTIHSPAEKSPRPRTLRRPLRRPQYKPPPIPPAHPQAPMPRTRTDT